MPRSLVFPTLFAAWFGAIQCGLTVLGYFSYWLSFRLLSSPIRPGLFSLTNWSTSYFLLSCVMGAVLGALFAVLDSRFHPEKNDADETLFRLLPHLLKSGAVAVGFILLYYGIFELFLPIYLIGVPPSAQTRYQNLRLVGSYIPMLSLTASLVWSMRKALHD